MYIKNFMQMVTLFARTNNDFSSTVLDQRHEQLSKDIKGDEGMVGLTEDEEKFRHWTICSPEIAAAVAEFEEGAMLQKSSMVVFITMKIPTVFKSDLLSMLMTY